MSNQSGEMTQKHRHLRAVAGALLIAAPLYLFGTFRHDLWRPAEAREAGIARAMIENGDWTATYLGGKIFLEKPPLYTWLLAGPLMLFGYQDWAVRLPVAVFTLATLALTYFLACEILPAFGAQAALVALATMCLFMEVNHGAMIDNGLVFFVLAAMFAVFRALETDSARWRLVLALLFYVILGLTFLCKGAIGVVLIAAALCGYCLHARQWHKLLRLYPLVGAAIFGLIVGLWLWRLWQRGGMEYFKIFFVDNHVRRFLGTFEPTKARWYYLPYLLVVALPWTFLIPGGMRVLFRQARNNAPQRRFMLFLCWWIAAMFLVLNAAGGKGHQYLMPILPPLAVFAGAWVEATVRGDAAFAVKWMRHLTVVFVSAAALAGAAFPVTMLILDKEAGMLIRLGNVVLALGMAAVALAVVRQIVRQDWRGVWRALAVSVVLAGVTIGWSVEPYLNRQKSMKPLARLLAQHMDPAAEFYGYALNENTLGALIFYGYPPRPIYDFANLRPASAAPAYLLITSYPPGRGPECFTGVLPDWSPVFYEFIGGRHCLLLHYRKHGPKS